MQRHIHHTTTIKPEHMSRRARVGTPAVLALVALGVAFILLALSSPTQIASRTVVARHTSASVAPVDPAQIAALERQQAALRALLSMQVAPADPAQIMALVRQHEAFRIRLGITVAPVDPAQIATLARQHEALHTRLGITVAPVDPAQITTLAR
jgi:hypothetical protein